MKVNEDQLPHRQNSGFRHLSTPECYVSPALELHTTWFIVFATDDPNAIPHKENIPSVQADSETDHIVCPMLVRDGDLPAVVVAP